MNFPVLLPIIGSVVGGCPPLHTHIDGERAARWFSCVCLVYGVSSSNSLFSLANALWPKGYPATLWVNLERNVLDYRVRYIIGRSSR